MIKIDSFKGLYPKLESSKLPVGGASIATDCNIHSGVLKAINISGTPVTMHTGGVQKGEVDTTTIWSDSAPSAPTSASLDYICQPLAGTPWLKTITAHAWVQYPYATNQHDIRTLSFSQALDIDSVEHTPYGLIVRASYGADFDTSALESSVSNEIFGPSYSFTFGDDEDSGSGTNYTNNGGPVLSADKTYPDLGTLLPTGPSVPLETVPLFWRGRHYASFNPIDVVGPDFSIDEMVLTSSVSRTLATSGTKVVFKINLQYTEAYYRYYRYVHSEYMTSGALIGQEGPLSDPSDMITVAPGQELTLNLNGTNSRPGRLYRADRDSGGKFYLIYDETTLTDSLTTSFVDANEGYIGDEAPLDGKIPSGVTAIPATTTIAGSFYHPAQFAVAYLDDELLLSEIAKPWQWPEEWRIPFDGDIDAIALAGSQIIVWTDDDKVWGVSGGDPSNMSKFLLSANHPLASVESICRIGSSLFYATNDGLAMVNGQTVELISGSHFDYETWQSYTPSTMKASVIDNAIWLDCSTGTDLRFDIEEDGMKVTSYSSLTPSTFTYQTGEMRFEKKTFIDALRITCDSAPTSVTLIVDGVDVDVPLDNDRVMPITDVANTWGYDFAVKIVGGGSTKVRSIELFEKKVLTVQGGQIRITPDMVDTWRRFHVRFPDRDAFCAGYLSAQDITGDWDNADIKINGVSQTIRPDNAFSITEVTEADLHTIEINTDDDRHIDELVLVARKRQPVSGGIIKLIKDDSGIPPWMYTEYQCDGNVHLTSGWVKGTGVNDITINGSTKSFTAENREFRLTGVEGSSFIFSFSDGDELVEEANIMIRNTEEIPVGGIFSPRDLSYGLASQHIRFTEPGAWASLKVVADEYDNGSTQVLQVSFYRDGSFVQTITVTDGKEQALPAAWDDGEQWEISVDHTGNIKALYIAGRVTRKFRNGLVDFTHLNERKQSRSMRLLCERSETPNCFRINSTKYPVQFTVSAEDGTELLDIAITADKAYRLPSMPYQRVWIIDLVPADGGTVNQCKIATSMSRLG